jgi:hypothetical protein
MPWLEIAEPIMRYPTEETLIAATWFLAQMQLKIVVTTKMNFEEEWGNRAEWLETLTHCINRTEELIMWLGGVQPGIPKNGFDFLKATAHLKLRYLRMSLRSIKIRVEATQF